MFQYISPVRFLHIPQFPSNLIRLLFFKLSA